MATINQKPVSAEKTAKILKITSIVFIVISALLLFLPVKYFTTGTTGITMKSGIFAKAIGAVFGGDGKILGFLPAISSSVLGISLSTAVYAMLAALIATIILAILALKKPERAALYLKIATFLFTWGIALYSLSILIVSSYLNNVKATVDGFTCFFALLGAALYFWMLWQSYNKKAWLLAGQFFLSLLAAGFLYLAMTHKGSIVSNAMRSQNAKLLLSLSAAAAMASIALTSILVLKLNKWTTTIQLINTIAMLSLSLCVALLSRIIRMSNDTYLLFSLLAAVVSFVQILVCVYQFYVASKVEDNALATLLASNYEKEEYIEVIPYNGDATGAQIAQLAEEPATAEAATEEVAATKTEEIADDPEKDALFEGKEDAFIATLTKAERYEFADLYILKTMGGIPKYEVGEDNKAFFSKVFVYLSQYRDKISSSLLAKIYEYAQN